MKRETPAGNGKQRLPPPPAAEPAGETEDYFRIDSRRKLVASLAEAIGGTSPECPPLVDLTAQAIDFDFDAGICGADVKEELDGHEVVHVEPVSSREAFTVMEDFAFSRPDGQAERLQDALSRRHPFRAFRAAVESLGILQEWYDWRDRAYEKIAEERLDDGEIDFEDGKIVCRNPDNIRIFVFDGGDDAEDFDGEI